MKRSGVFKQLVEKTVCAGLKWFHQNRVVANCHLLGAHHVISLLRSNSVASEVKRTSITERDL